MASNDWILSLKWDWAAGAQLRKKFETGWEEEMGSRKYVRDAEFIYFPRRLKKDRLCIPPLRRGP